MHARLPLVAGGAGLALRALWANPAVKVLLGASALYHSGWMAALLLAPPAFTAYELARTLGNPLLRPARGSRAGLVLLGGFALGGTTFTALALGLWLAGLGLVDGPLLQRLLLGPELGDLALAAVASGGLGAAAGYWLRSAQDSVFAALAGMSLVLLGLSLLDGSGPTTVAALGLLLCVLSVRFWIWLR
jgi:hypothetical protein